MKWVIKNVTVFCKLHVLQKWLGAPWRPLWHLWKSIPNWKVGSWPDKSINFHPNTSIQSNSIAIFENDVFVHFLAQFRFFQSPWEGMYPTQTPLNIIKVDPLRVRNEQQKSQKTLGNGLFYWEPVDLLNFLLAANLFCLSNSVGGDKGSDSSAQTAEAAAITTPDS